jgi:hypothetical protein
MAIGQKGNNYLENSQKIGLVGLSDFSIKNRVGGSLSYATYKSAFHYIADLRGCYYKVKEKEVYKSISVSYGIGVRAITLGNSININLTVAPTVGYEHKESLISVGNKLDLFKYGGFVRGEVEVNIINLNTLVIGAEQEYSYYTKISDYIFRRNLYLGFRISI